MKLTGKKNERIIDLTYYMLKRTMYILFILGVFSFLLNQIDLLFVFSLPIILISLMRKESFKLFMNPATRIIEWKYKKYGYFDKSLSGNQNKTPGEWDCINLLIEYISKDKKS